jgi:hypothetical protein
MKISFIGMNIYIFTKCRERHCVVVFLKVLRLNLNLLLRTLTADEGLNIRSEFLPDLTRIMNEIWCPFGEKLNIIGLY